MYVALDTQSGGRSGVSSRGLEGGAVAKTAMSSAQLTNTQLVQLIDRIACHRDRQAFALLFDHFAPKLKAFLRRRNVSPALADDVTQEAMLTVWRRAEKFDASKAAASTWIFTIARNLHIDHFRKAARSSRLDEHDPYLKPAAEPQPDDLVSRSEDVETVSEALSVLPDEQRLVLELAFTEGLSHASVADRLSLPLGTVKSRIRLAMNKLREVLGERE